MGDKFERDLEFEWDEGNNDKNFVKHGVGNREAEEVFFDRSLLVTKDEKHSTAEPRYQVLGKTKRDRKLTVYFTLRSKKIRIISARLMSKKERKQYKQSLKLKL